MKRLILALGAAAVLAGCATVGAKFSQADLDGLRPGMTEAEVTSKLGQPSTRSSMADGRHVLVWLYGSANGFTGKNESGAVSLAFDKDGRFVREVSRSQVGG